MVNKLFDPYKDEDVGEEVYEEEGLENLEENDEISPEEEAFMEGYIKTPPKARKKKEKKKSNIQKKTSVTKKKRKPTKHAKKKRR